MSDLDRVSFTIESELLDEMDSLLQEERYLNRSEFLRDLIRERLAKGARRRTRLERASGRSAPSKRRTTGFSRKPVR